ncbi:uncharacterized protein LOC125456532 [Stegostoma tigrinum]|uniref:uncharacterized protein LOC125456532 n=1 Tax=Stegostoma tigrinum TaxID=3053191 RepID=UPI00286FD178|nr:uncharacterized protein LOC125456532 [Stegostoma tigrinum]XP_059504219.1 uncharacterized protein LOC125456532 [Stegostoma tigrinum]XP_059504220.1 uncharacterized protein LOC125456532 [Stegostoma tigrinum]XP_059504221.1 uncharacterized protein LOC125456532 [Stegostoma tigrinum]
MGTRMGPSYACLFVGYVEQSLFRTYTGPKPHLFLRYIDDCIGATSCSPEELEQFIHFTNTFHPNLQFTWAISSTSLTFLDLSVSISGNQLVTDVHFKPTDSHSYLEYTSSHPPSCKNSIPYSQFLRLRRICSHDKTFHSRTSQMSKFFKVRNFPPTVIENALDRVSRISRNTSLTPRPRHNRPKRIPLVLTHHPTNLRIQRIILRHFRHSQSDPTTQDIFPSPPLSAFRRDHSLHDSLVRSTLPSNPTTPSIFPCNCRKCHTFPHTSSLTPIPGPKMTFHSKQRFTCTSANVVYCIHCTRCGFLYIGETKRRLGDRFADHLRSVRNKQLHLPVANHFHSPSHSLDDMSIMGLLHCHNDATRRLQEQQLIFRLGTPQPNGINVDFTSFKISPSPTASLNQPSSSPPPHCTTQPAQLFPPTHCIPIPVQTVSASLTCSSSHPSLPPTPSRTPIYLLTLSHLLDLSVFPGLTYPLPTSPPILSPPIFFTLHLRSASPSLPIYSSSLSLSPSLMKGLRPKRQLLCS